MSVDFLQMRRRRNSQVSSKPCWLQSSINELDRRMQEVSLDPTDDIGGDSFAGRAEIYYRKRPQLLTLLQDVYRRYLSLADRYAHIRSQTQHATCTSDTTNANSDEDAGSSIGSCCSSAAISCHTVEENSSCTTATSSSSSSRKRRLCTREEDEDDGEEAADLLVVEAVANQVEADLLRHELECERSAGRDSARKIELQQSLLEVLESERLILLGENGRLSYRVAAVTEENKGLIADVVFLKRKVGELGRCLLKLRDDHRVCMLSRRVEDLQAQVYGLEKRNRECLGRMGDGTGGGGGRRAEAALVASGGGGFGVEMEMLRRENFRLKEALGSREPSVASTSSSALARWAERAKRVRFFVCGFASSARSERDSESKMVI
ncbi:kinase-interacting family protein [Nymphaea colorata]|nr:kinase-interacting family protein [Nymphaea colorata]